MIRLLFVVFFFSFATSDPPPLQTCDSTVGKVVEAKVTNSKFINGRYILKRGSSAGIEIQFKLVDDVKAVTASAEGVLFPGLPSVPYPLPNTSNCPAALECSLAKGGPYDYKTTLNVYSVFPQIPVDVKWKLKNENEEVIACILIPAKIE